MTTTAAIDWAWCGAVWCFALAALIFASTYAYDAYQGWHAPETPGADDGE